MKKIIFAVLLACSLFVSACCGYRDGRTSEYSAPFKEFYYGSYYRLMYDTETRVVYMVSSTYKTITPLYNADGTLKTYNINAHDNRR